MSDKLVGRTPELSVADFVASLNQTLQLAYPAVILVGEVAEYQLSQGKYVFFKLKDQGATVSCFMMAFRLSTPLENGMKLRVLAEPRLREANGAFSLTVAKYQPVGEGSIKQALEALKRKLAAEGLFAPEQKRPLPEPIGRIAVISSVDAAGYRDFLKILAERTGGLEIEVINTAVQGLNAPEEISRALAVFNQRATADVICLIRGGGSQDDLAAFNDETLARAIRASRLPVLVGVGHEVDETIADLVADLRASTPTHAAQLLTPRDKREQIAVVRQLVERMERQMLASVRETPRRMRQQIELALEQRQSALTQVRRVLAELDPEKVLARGYAILSGKVKLAEDLRITTKEHIIRAKIEQIEVR